MDAQEFEERRLDFIRGASLFVVTTFVIIGMFWYLPAQAGQVQSISFSPMSSAPITCNSSNTGSLYVDTSGALNICNGSNYNAVVTGGGTTQLNAGYVTGGTFGSLSSAGNYAFDTNTLFIDATNHRVGIGTTNPSVKLEVSDGSSAILGITKTGTGAGTMQLIEDGVYPRIFGPSSSNFYLGVTGDSVGAALTLKPGGNVGINTTSPGTNLDVNGNIQSSVYYDRDNTNYYMDLGANTLPYSITTAGSVGIGTTSPGARLDVWGGAIQNRYGFASLPGVSLMEDGDNGRIRIYSATGGSPNAYTYEIQNARTSLQIGYVLKDRGTELSSDFTNLFTLTNSGNVSVSGGISISPSSVYGFGGTDTSISYLATNKIGFANAAGTQALTVNTSNGHIGIGTTSPTTILDIGGGYDYINTSGTYQIVPTTAKTIQVHDINNSALNLVSDANTDGAILGAVMFSRSGGQSDAHFNVAGIRAVEAGTGPLAGAALQFYTKQNCCGMTAPRMSIDNLGNVGINTTNPTSKLMVSGGDVAIPDATEANDTFAATVGYVKSAVAGGSGSSVGYWTLSGSNLYSDSASYNVGIGTTSPGAKLDVAGNQFLTGATAYNYIDFKPSGTQKAIIGMSGPIKGDSSQDLGLFAEIGQGIAFMSGGSATTRMYIDTSGNVGIGTTSPGSPLEVYSAGADNTLTTNMYLSAAHGTNRQIALGFGRSDHYNAYQSRIVSNMSSVTTYGSTLQIQTMGGSSPGIWNTGLFINSAGNVGINTNSPGTNLDVNGNTNSSIYYDRDNTNYYMDPAANTMPYSINTAGAVSFGGYELLKGTKTDVVTASGTGDLTIPLGLYNVGSNIRINFNASGGWAEGGVDFDLNSTWSNYPQVTVLSDTANFAPRVTFYAQPNGSPNWGSVWLFAVWTNNSPSKSSSNTVTFRINSSGNFDISNTTSTIGWTQLSSYNLVNTGGNIGIGTESPSAKLQVNGDYYSPTVVKGNCSGAVTIDWSQGNTQHCVLTGNVTFTFTNGQSGGNYRIILKQDSTGSRTVTWPSNVRWGGTGLPTLSTAPNNTDYVGFIYNGVDSKYDGVAFNSGF